MNTTGQTVGMVRRRRRSYSEEFKANAVGACLQPGMSMAAVSLSRRLNANLLRRWVVEAERTGSMRQSSHNTAPVESGGRFIPVPLVSVPAELMIRIELRSGSGTVVGKRSLGSVLA